MAEDSSQCEKGHSEKSQLSDEKQSFAGDESTDDQNIQHSTSESRPAVVGAKAQGSEACLFRNSRIFYRYRVYSDSTPQH